VPLAQVAEIRIEWQPAKIFKRDRLKAVVVGVRLKRDFTAAEGFTQIEEVPKERLTRIQQYFDLKLRQALSSKYKLSDKPSEDTAHIKIAITSVHLNSEGIKITEVLPYGAVIGLIRAATDTRNREVTVILEMEILNSKTHEPIVALVRVGEGKNVRMLWDDEFTLNHVKELLDNGGDIRSLT
jgi:hypothetical protein